MSLPEPLLVRSDYGERRSLTRVYDSSGLPSIFEYDERSWLTRREDRNGTWYGYEYDGQGRCVAATGTDQVLEYRYRYAREDFRTTAVNCTARPINCYDLDGSPRPSSSGGTASRPT